MKKNITVNLFGQLYAIDEDACKLLDDYLENMKRYFSRREGGEEIADDIEHRVAELFSELKENGVDAISIDHVSDIIHRIGNPEEMEEALEENGAVPPPPPSEHQTNKKSDSLRARKLYRDPEDQMLGGVMSGLCWYFGGSDPLPWRIIMVILAFFSLTTIGILYLLAWAFIPRAVTAEERLQMKGSPINPETINAELMRQAGRAGDYLRSNEFKSGARSFFDTLLHIIVFFLKFLVLFIAGCLLLATVVFIGALAAITIGGTAAFVKSGMMDVEAMKLMSAVPGLNWQLWIICLASLATIIIIVYAIIRSFIKKAGDRPLHTGTRVTLTLIAILCAATAITMSVFTGLQIAKAEKLIDRQENTKNGIYIHAWDRHKLEEGGWNVRVLKNYDEKDGLYRSTDGLTKGSPRAEYIRFSHGDSNGKLEVLMDRSENYPAGRYYLEGMAYSKGAGNYIFVRNDSITLGQCEIPIDDASGYGNMARMSITEFNRTGILSEEVNLSDWIKHVSKNIKGWSYIRTTSFDHPGGALTFGVTNIPNHIGLNGVKSSGRKFGFRYLRVVKDTTNLSLNQTF